jgi:hypothetical protein
MFRKLVALLPVAAALIAASDAHGFTMDNYGAGVDKDADEWDAPTVAPHASCESLMLYLADAPADATKLRRYRFTGTCVLNVAREKKAAKMVKLEVLVDAEYHPGLKRASERLTVKHPDVSLDLSTWATCPADPFVGTNVTCTDKGMGATKWDKFINKDDAPFARQRATPGMVAAAAATFDKAKQRGATNLDFFKAPSIFRLQPPGKSAVGAESYVTFDVTGASGMCPSEVDFGDGSKQTMIVWGMDPFQHQTKHAYKKPGYYKVTARSLPGCEGEAIAYKLVK